MPPSPIPEGFGLCFRPDVRRPRREVLIGGTPVRVLRLTEAGAAMVERWRAGRPVGPGRGAGVLAARLVDAGIADPRPPQSAPPEVAVVVPVRDDAAGLAATLEALGATAPGVKILVVDDGSDPLLVAEAGGTRLVRRPQRGGPAAARNTGWIQLGGDVEVVIFVDAGCVPEPGWLPSVLAHFADPAVAAVAPRVRSRPGYGTPAPLARYEAARSSLDMGRRGAGVRPGSIVPYVPSAVLAVRTVALRRAGGFDEHLRFGEDVDLIWRLHRDGGRVRYEPGASASHPARPTWRAWLRQRYDYGGSAAPLAARHGRAVAPLAASPWSVAAWALAAAGWPEGGAGVVGVTAWALGRKAGRDRVVAAELRRLALAGNLRAGGALASAVRRAWLPPAAVLGGTMARFGGRRTRLSLAITLAVVAAGPGLADWWRRRPEDGPIRWATWCLADDLAYQTGLWAGMAKRRTIGPIRPRW